MADELVRVDLDPNLPLLLSRSAIVSTTSMEMAEKIAEEARGIAPVDTGQYRDGIRVEKGSNGWARVRATDQKSAWVEFGNNHQPARWILRSAAEMLGLKFVKRK